MQNMTNRILSDRDSAIFIANIENPPSPTKDLINLLSKNVFWINTETFEFVEAQKEKA